MRTTLRNAACAGLVAFHGVLLWQRCADGTILDAGVLARYLGAALIMVGLFVFKRLAPPHLQGRRALVVFWLIVLMLHAGAPFSTGTRDIQGELVAVIELGLALPLALFLAQRIAASASSLRVLHDAAIAGIPVPVDPERIQLPARAPPSAR